MERAQSVFEDLFGLERTKDFTGPAGLTNNLFGVDQEARILVYAAGPVDLEVFVSQSAAGRAPGFAHLCMGAANRDELVAKAEHAGFGVRRHARPDGSFIIFIRDLDGNLFEIKEL
jgi:catechol 2,3-dioxygenase-like lactoylglutathione lyase family enzyme